MLLGSSRPEARYMARTVAEGQTKGPPVQERVNSSRGGGKSLLTSWWASAVTTAISRAAPIVEELKQTFGLIYHIAQYLEK